MPTEKNSKNKGGRPGSYKEPKQNISISVTRVAVDGLDDLAEQRNLSRSELIEQIGRGAIALADPDPEDIEVVAFSLWELDRLGDVLLLQHSLLTDELMERGLFESRPITEERAEVCQYLLEYLEKLLSKIRPPSRTLFEFREVHPPVSNEEIRRMKENLQILTSKISVEVAKSFEDFNRLYLKRVPWRADSFVRASFGEIQPEVQVVLEQLNWENCHEHLRRSINQLPEEPANLAKKVLLYVLSYIDTSAMYREKGFSAQKPFFNLSRWLSSSVNNLEEVSEESYLETSARLASKYFPTV